MPVNLFVFFQAHVFLQEQQLQARKHEHVIKFIYLDEIYLNQIFTDSEGTRTDRRCASLCTATNKKLVTF